MAQAHLDLDFVTLSTADIDLVGKLLDRCRETHNDDTAGTNSEDTEADSMSYNESLPEQNLSVVYECPCTESSTVRDDFVVLVLYCATPDCKQYLNKSTYSTDNKWAACSTCNSKTCTTCNSLKSWHTDQGKCADSIEPESREEMRRRGFKPCPWCKQMIERDYGCDHMHCDQCGKNFCYNCGRKKGRSELPCNCRGEHEWVDEAMEEMNPEAQQDILDRIQNGMNLPQRFHDLRDIELLPEGRFRGMGRRVGEEGDEPAPAENIMDDPHVGSESEPEPEPAARAGPRRQIVRQGFNHWQAMQDFGENERFFYGGNFMGAGLRLGEENEERLEGQDAMVPEPDIAEWAAPDADWGREVSVQMDHYNFYGRGRRLDDAEEDLQMVDNDNVEEEDGQHDTDMNGWSNADEEDDGYNWTPGYAFGVRYGGGRPLGDGPVIDRTHDDADASNSMDVSPDVLPHVRQQPLQDRSYGQTARPLYLFSGQGRTLGEIAAEVDVDNDAGPSAAPEVPSPQDNGFNHFRAREYGANGRGAQFGYRHFRGGGQRLGD
ncbi:hypothetical protein LTR05_007998 [Lithohypha guttulata]|uniref:RING-type domain-containing protein n=1 Tax=Lithohypha guttulata TaxID=1690604 RepID=A0AAN7STM1_9EURO|nr:hypothetical protein LTR05_007998 [Lithohypha guttulata]